MLQMIMSAVMLGLIWSVMTIGVYITFRILGIADLTVEGSIAMGGAIAAQAIYSGSDPTGQHSLPFWAVWLPDWQRAYCIQSLKFQHCFPVY